MSCKELNSENYSHAEKLNGFIEDVLRDSGHKLVDLDAVAVSAGPGSYTGLRIGSSTAKGLCYGLNIPLIAVPSLQALAALAKSPSDLICPMFDARRMEVYSQLYDADLNAFGSLEAVVLDDYQFEDVLSEKSVLFLGPGAEKAADLIQGPNAIFDLETMVSARGMMQIAHQKFLSQEFEDTAYFEPNYLKEFIAGKPKTGLQF